ncbi:glycoside hydrolase family protein [Klebsiella quasipneumoniae]|uniref:glycoside hydrolase family protein n=1 Tax=Klebsiella quasipneumoniae TaxID=1463165 RepID=UPI003DA02E65
MGIENSNQGPGWHDHDTPYGTIHSYDGDTGTYGGGGTGGNAGGGHTGLTANTWVDIATTKDYNGRYMSMCLNNLKDHEGSINTMHRDSKGNITVGIGHYLGSAEMAQALPFNRTKVMHVHGDDLESEVAVSKSDIASAFNAYKSNPRDVPSMHLSNADVIGQCIKDVQTTENGLRGLYPGYDRFSDPRKTALVDMGFNLGIPTLKSKFPKFNDAVNRGDWNVAADESHRDLNQRGDKRNKDTADQLRYNR